MSFTRDLVEQTRSVFSKMPVSSQLTSALLVLIVVVGFAYSMAQTKSPNTEMLFGGRLLSEQELDSVEMSFSRAGLNDWKREGRRISIPIETRNQYLAALEQSSALPISIRSSVQDAIEKTTIFESSAQRIAREMHAKEQDLGNKLSAFPQIRWASVEYDMGERQGLGRSRTQSASVVVCPEGGECLSATRIRMIQEFIRGSYAGMSADNVVVIDTNASENVCQMDPIAQQQAELKARLEQKIRETLIGYGDIRIEAFVGLERPASQLTDQELPDQPIQPSAQPNATAPERVTLLRPAQLASGALRTVSRSPPVASVKSLRISIGLPESYYQQVLQRTYARTDSPVVEAPVPRMAELDAVRERTKRNIQAAVMPSLMAILADKGQSPIVEVWEYPDATNLVAANGLSPDVLAWLRSNWQQATLVLLGLIGVCVAYFVFRSETTTQAPSRSPDSFETSVPETQSDDFGYQMESASEDEDLLALVESDPNAAVEVIRDWISKAA